MLHDGRLGNGAVARAIPVLVRAFAIERLNKRDSHLRQRRRATVGGVGVYEYWRAVHVAQVTR